MSAALLLTAVWGSGALSNAWELEHEQQTGTKKDPEKSAAKIDPPQKKKPASPLAFYRKHTEGLLRRYLYASMQVGRAPSILGEPFARGWVSSRRVRTFEDAIIFVLDVEKCLARLDLLDRRILSRVVLQEYTHVEAAMMLGLPLRTFSYKFPRALDKLTEKLLNAGLLVLPHSSHP